MLEVKNLSPVKKYTNVIVKMEEMEEMEGMEGISTRRDQKTSGTAAQHPEKNMGDSSLSGGPSEAGIVVDDEDPAKLAKWWRTVSPPSVARVAGDPWDAVDAFLTKGPAAANAMMDREMAVSKAAGAAGEAGVEKPLGQTASRATHHGRRQAVVALCGGFSAEVFQVDPHRCWRGLGHGGLKTQGQGTAKRLDHHLGQGVGIKSGGFCGPCQHRHTHTTQRCHP